MQVQLLLFDNKALIKTTTLRLSIVQNGIHAGEQTQNTQNDKLPDYYNPWRSISCSYFSSTGTSKTRWVRREIACLLNTIQNEHTSMNSLIGMFSNTRSTSFSSVSVTLYSVILSVGRNWASHQTEEGPWLEGWWIEGINRSESTRYRVNLVQFGICRQNKYSACVNLINYKELTVALNPTDLISPLSRIRCRSSILHAQCRIVTSSVCMLECTIHTFCPRKESSNWFTGCSPHLSFGRSHSDGESVTHTDGVGVREDVLISQSTHWIKNNCFSWVKCCPVDVHTVLSER